MAPHRHNNLKQISNLLPTKRSITLRGADPIAQRGFTQVPDHFLQSPAVSPGAKLVYAMLLKYAWYNDYCFPGQDTVAKDMGVSRQTVNTHIRELATKGLIAVKRQGQG